jgi:histidinol-phosphate/aromatic aminotransferase/cobyric acid decarboxylase-like protein
VHTSNIAGLDESGAAGACFHGGAFFESVGPRFDDLRRAAAVINADVLDAWFDPAPGVLEALADHLPWLCRTSPPTRCEGLVAELALARGVPQASVVPGAGSSDLIFRALREWLSPSSLAVILEPTYAEYPFVLENVIGCRVRRVPLDPEANFAPDLDALDAAARGADLVVIVNPNSPTGTFFDPEALWRLIERHTPGTRFWIDEAYIDYISPAASLEQRAANREGVVICKTMSKVYALSGMRAGYLCGRPDCAARLLRITPPWVIGLPAQVAAVEALRDPEYYCARWSQTHELRRELAIGLRAPPWLRIWEGPANFILCEMEGGPAAAAALIASLRADDIFLRDVSTGASGLIRVAVKNAETNQRVIDAVRRATDVAGKEATSRRSIRSHRPAPCPRLATSALPACGPGRRR